MSKSVSKWNAAQLLEELEIIGLIRDESATGTGESPVNEAVAGGSLNESLTGKSVTGESPEKTSPTGESVANASSAKVSLIDDIIKIRQNQKIPTVLKILVGIGAIIASILFFVCIAIAIFDVFDYGEVVMGSGFLLLLVSIGIQKTVMNAKDLYGASLGYCFFEEVALTVLILGHILLIAGMFLLKFYGWHSCFIFFITACVVYPLYHMSIARFFMVLNVLCFVLANIIMHKNMYMSQTQLFNAFILFQCASVAFLFGRDVIKSICIPLAYALILSLCISLLALSSMRAFDFIEVKFFSPLFSTMVVGAGLIALLTMIASKMNKLRSEPFLLACIGVVLLSVISAPGIIFAIAIITLGYAKEVKFLSVMGILFMILFTILYYYNLNISLLIKSLILMGSGVILLTGRFYLVYRGWDKVGVSCEQK